MQKGRIIGLLKQHGDVILTRKVPKKQISTYHLCTIEFKNKYIKSMTKGKKPWPKDKSNIVVFDWTNNKYWILNPAEIVKAQPLSEVLKNAGKPTYD